MKKIDLLIALLLLFGLSSNIMAQLKKVSDARLKEVQTEVDELNVKIKKNGLSWKAGVTSISLLTDEEKRHLCGLPYEEKNTNIIYTKHIRQNAALKKNALTEGVIVSLIDWMSPVSYQGLIGNCYVHATMGAVEAELNRYDGQNIGIILDDWYLTVRSGGGNGGDPGTVLNIIKENKVPSKPGMNSSPNFDGAYWTITGYTMESDLKALLDDGKPVIASLDTCYRSFFDYMSGVYEPSPGEDYLQTGNQFGHDPFVSPIGHAIVVIGYGIEDNKEYWLCRNSWYDRNDPTSIWGTGHGDPKYNGYFKIRKGRCGVGLNATNGHGFVVTINESRCLAKVVPEVITSVSNALSYDFVNNECAYLTSPLTISNPTSLNFTTKNSLTFINNGTLQINNRLTVNGSGKIIGNGVLSIGSLGQVVFNNSSALMARNDVQLGFPSSFRNYFSLSLNPASNLPPGNDGTYEVNNLDMGTSWSGTAITDHTISLKAEYSNGYIVQWSNDGSTDNPRTLTPSNITLNAIYKNSTIAPPHATDANPVTSTSFTAHWDAVSGATKYFIDVASIDPIFGDELPLLTNNGVNNVTSFQVTDLKPNTTYHYRVRSFNLDNGGQQSINSNTVTVTTLLPPPPTLASPINNTNNVLIPPTVTWNASEGATQYVLQLSTSSQNFESGKFFEVTKSNPNYRSYTFNNLNLAFYTKYSWRVRANNPSSGWSEIWSFTTEPISPIPTATPATNICSSFFTANWTAVSGAMKYYLDAATDAGFTSYVDGYNNLDLGNITSYSVTGLNPSTTYYYRVRSYNGASSPNSNTILVATNTAPIATGATKNTFTSFRANWTAVSGATKYYFDVAADGAFTSFISGYNNVDAGNTTFYLVTGLNPNTIYYYRVRSFNGTQGANSNIIAAPTVPTAPTANAATNIGSKSFYTNWTAVSGAILYYLDVATDTNFTSFVGGLNNYSIAGNTTSQQVVSLNPNTNYYYRVRSYNGVQSLNSNRVTLTTAPPPPTATAATNIMPTSFTANWTAVSGAVKYYLDVIYYPNGGGTAFVNGYNNKDVGNTTSWQVTGLNPNTYYTYKVRMYNGIRSSDPGSMGVSTATDIPIALSATNITGNSFTANWTAVIGASMYYIDVATDTSFSTIVNCNTCYIGGGATSYWMGGLSNTTYYYRVRSWSGGVQSPSSNRIAATTAPVAPTNTDATNIASTSFTANWTAVSGATKYYLDVATDVIFTSFVDGYNNKDVGNKISCSVTGLNYSTTYYYRARAYNGAQSSNNNAKYATTLPAPPTATPATNIAYTKFTANWTAVSGATKYYLDVATDTSFTLFVNGYNNLNVGTATSYLVTGLNPNTIYRYRLHSKIGVISPNSNTVVLTTALYSPFSATGGTITYSGGNTIHTFTSSGTFILTGSGIVEVLVVAGGGGGGANRYYYGGGGGAGGVAYFASKALTSGNYTVTIGSGGAVGVKGGNSVFGTISAVGGGYGGASALITGNGTNGGNGGSGGGGGGCGSGYTPGNGGDGDSTGHIGSAGLVDGEGGGGGGAGSSGQVTGTGGSGVTYSISGTVVWYASGGGFSGDNLSGGGGGSGTAGKSGIVIISYYSGGSAKDLYGNDGTFSEGSNSVPTEYGMSQNYPNPFNPITVVSYQLPVAGHVMLKVYDMLGREVVTLVDDTKEAGYYKATFNASHLSSGIYFARVVAQSDEGKPFVHTIKLMLMK